MLGALSVLAGLIGVSVLIVLLSDRIEKLKYRLRNSPEKVAAERARRLQRLLAPDWPFYEQHLGRPAPVELRELFADTALLTHPHTLSAGDIYITSFEPLDRESLVHSEKWLGLDVVPIASSDGDLIYLKPGKGRSDNVYITYHDGGKTEELVHDVAAFLQAVRGAKTNAL